MVAVSGLRPALAAIANAEAVPLPAAPSGQPPAGDQHVAGSQRVAGDQHVAGSQRVAGDQHVAGSQRVAGSTAGLGGGEASRRAVTEDEATAIAAAEVTERRAAAREYEAAGQHGRADRLLREARAVESALSEPALDMPTRRDDA